MTEIYRELNDEEQVATVLELLATVFSAIHNPENDNVPNYVPVDFREKLRATRRQPQSSVVI